MLSLDGTFIIIFFSFLIFMGLMKVLFFDPMRAIQGQRQASIEDGLEKAASAQTTLNDAEATYKQKLAQSHHDAQQLIQQKRDDARAKAADVLIQARQRAQAEFDAKLASIHQAQAEANQQLKSTYYNDIVDSVVHKVIESRPLSTAGPGSY